MTRIAARLLSLLQCALFAHAFVLSHAVLPMNDPARGAHGTWDVVVVHVSGLRASRGAKFKRVLRTCAVSALNVSL